MAEKLVRTKLDKTSTAVELTRVEFLELMGFEKWEAFQREWAETAAIIAAQAHARNVGFADVAQLKAALQSFDPSVKKAGSVTPQKAAAVLAQAVNVMSDAEKAALKAALGL